MQPECHAMEQRLKLSKTSAAAPVNPTWYRGIVGCLRYLVHTRPDIAFSVGYVSRFMEAPTTEHEAAVKCILRYIAGTTEFGCHYHQSSSPVQLVGYSDADMAGDPDTRKSTTGVVFFLGTSPVSWQSVKQKVVALSSCEAEYIAATTAACQGVWLSQLLGEINQEELDAFKLLIDNKSAIALSKNPVFHERSKHIATRYHYIRERVEDGSVHVEFVGTEGQIADILTKALGRTRFLELRSRIGVADVKFRCKT
ncbi:secreted RxLR effector protein 161-like [Oryza glaberrima]|uniref:secreted RxLR effector protein 161-like n=1 Tax=Oryza glaberrima TaxID=4538 RepID=UPI00224C5102|nr:secreted RxLR effector protein 161-like [Oryza glaberrima]